MKRGDIALKNVVGVLDGSGPLADETVIVGAHYDHLGYGAVVDIKMVIHPRADDNASGTSAVMELARRFAGDPPAGARRRLVFTAFSAEEIGLLGSADYTKHPVFPLEKTAAMVNFDMVGRLQPDMETKQDTLLVDGTDTAPTFDALLEDVNKKYGFRLVKKPSGLGQSDQASFYLKRVPVIFYHTGHHPDWHCPSDTADKINVPGMRKVTDFAEATIARLATVGRKPVYVRVLGGGGPSYASSVPHLGIQPSYTDAEVDKGVLLQGVSEGGPAAKAGLKAGDRIVEVSGQPVKNMASYMTAMSGRKKIGDLELVIVRGDKRLPVKVHLD
jgi:Zn-dependent M28 family amino/carboxypeptidase